MTSLRPAAALAFALFCCVSGFAQTPPVASSNEETFAATEKGAAKARIKDYLERHGDHGKIDPALLLERTRTFKAELERVERPGRAIRAQAIGGTVWTNIGPTNGAGRATALALDPTNVNNAIIGAAGGGAWKTTNGGAAWTPLTETVANLSVGAVAYAPSNVNIVYLGSGEGGYAVDFIPGIGLLASADGGTNWTLPASVIASMFYKIAVHPTNANELVVGTNNGGLRSTNGQNGPWTTVINPNSAVGVTGYGDVTDIVRDPGNPLVMYATTFDRFQWCARFGCANPNNRVSPTVLKSLDGGQTWAPAATGLPVSTVTLRVNRMAIAIAPSNTQVLYAATSTLDFNTGVESSRIYKTVNGGGSWTETNLGAAQTPNYLGTQGWYDNTIVVKPSDANTVIAGGVNYMRTADGGASWQRAFSNGGVHVDAHDLKYDASGAILWVANDGGIWTSNDDATANQTDRNAGLVTRQFYAIANDPVNRNRVYGGQQDNGTIFRPDAGGTAWSFFSGGDGFTTLVNETSPAVAFGTIQFGEVLRTRNAGAASPSVRRITPLYAPDESTPFFTLLAQDPNQPNTVFAASTRLWKSTLAGDGWAPLPITTTDGSTWNPSTIRAIDIARSNSNIIMVAKGFEVFRSTNGGASWIKTSSGLPGKSVNGLTIDPNNAQVAFVALAGSSGHPVYYTTNGGGTWTQRRTGLPQFSAFVVRFDPTDSNILFCGTDVGVYRSTDGGANWTRFGTGMPAVSVYDLQVLRDGTILRAGTHGRGIWQLTVTSPSNNAPAVAISAPATAVVSIAKGASLSFTGTFSDPDLDPVTATWTFGDVWSSQAATSGATVNHTFHTAGRIPVTLAATDSDGGRGAASIEVDVTEAGETCASPLAIPGAGPFPYSVALTTELSTREVATDPNPVGACYPFTPQSALWLSFTPAASGTYQFSFCGSSASATLAGFTGNACGPYTSNGICLVRNDDGDCDSNYSIALTAGVPIRLLVTNYWSGDFGPVTLTVTQGDAFTPATGAVVPPAGTALGGTPVVITGTGFLAGAIVRFGGTQATNVTVVTPSLITATTPAHAPGAVTVSVQNPAAATSTLANSFTYTPLAGAVRYDFGADGRSDILWRNNASGQTIEWVMNGAAISSSANVHPGGNAGWTIAGIADFNGDSRADLLFRDNASGATVLWLMNGGVITSSLAVHPGGNTGWTIQSVNDFDGNARADILWRNTSSGQTMLWSMNGAAISSSTIVHPGGNTGWTIPGTGDFNADGKADILWRATATGQVILWTMNGASIASSFNVHPGGNTGWSIVNVADLTGDGKSDVLWRNNSTGQTLEWVMNGGTITSTVAIHPGGNTGWNVAAVGDFNGDQKYDLLWRDTASGQTVLWLMNAGGIASTGVVHPGGNTGWNVVSTR